MENGQTNMQTFYPFEKLSDTVQCLDKKRCWKQVVECHQILNVLEGHSTGWRNHPAVKMWRGHTDFLKRYYNSFFFHSVATHGIKAKKLGLITGFDSYAKPPSWVGNKAFHESHQSNLARKALEDIQKRGSMELYNNLLKYGVDANTFDTGKPYVWPLCKNLLDVE